ncbi:hypothetical protein Tco_1186774, partial [Tanacetum coccineum]
LISWQCKKQTVVANSITEAKYVAASSCCGQVLWIKNQLLDYGYNFMHTKIYIDNESTICIVKNPIFHSKTKYIEIRHHFINDSNEKKLIQMIKIHTDKNVADLLTKAFDKGIGVNAGDSKLMLLGINLLLLESTVKAKTVNGEVQLQALVDGKKIIVTEASVGLSARVVSSEDEGLGEEDASKQGRKIHDIDADENITLENIHDEDMFDIGVFNDEEVFAGQDMVEKEVSTADLVTTAGEVVTTANVKTHDKRGCYARAKTTTTTIPSKDKGKGIMVEEPLKMKKKDQVLFDEQEAIRLPAQFDEEERIAIEKEEDNAN